VLIFFFGDYIFLILCVCAISKKYLKTKRKNLFAFDIFLPIAREKKREREGGSRKKKQRKSNTLTG